MENARRRLWRSTRRKIGAEFYTDFRRRWIPFVLWIHYNLLYEQIPSDAGRYPAVQRIHRAQLHGVESLLRNLISERCETQVSDVQLPGLAMTVKRHGRRRRFAGASLRQVLAKPDKYNDLVFAYLRKFVNLELKAEYLDLSTRQSRRAAGFRAALTIARPPESSSTTTASATPSPADHEVARDQTPAAVAKKNLKTSRTRRRISRKELVEAVKQFLIERVDPTLWNTAIDQLGKVSVASSPDPQPLTVDEAIALAKPPWEPESNFEQCDWDAAWLFGWLSKFVPQSDMREILIEGLNGARELDRSGAGIPFLSL